MIWYDKSWFIIYWVSYPCFSWNTYRACFNDCFWFHNVNFEPFLLQNLMKVRKKETQSENVTQVWIVQGMKIAWTFVWQGLHTHTHFCSLSWINMQQKSSDRKAFISQALWRHLGCGDTLCCGFFVIAYQCKCKDLNSSVEYYYTRKTHLWFN